MGKNEKAPAKAGATPEEVIENAVVETATEETSVEETAVEETATEVVETLVNGEFEVNGKIWKLSDRCPSRVKFNGTIYSRNELLTNEELQQSLVIGKSPFVKKA